MRRGLIHSLNVYFHLFRWKNLFIIALSMIMVRYALIHPVLGIRSSDFPLTHFNFFLLVFSIILLASAGYVINDYFDLKIDRINKPEKMILGRFVPLKQALTIHQVFSTIGIILGFYVAYQAGSLRIGGIQLILVAVLWYYSYRYKGLMIWGNLVVSLVSGFSIVLVWLFEFYSLKQDALLFGTAIPGFKAVTSLIFIYFLFSFFISFAREILKDIVDIPGDSRYGCRTLAIKLGTIKAKHLALGLLIAVLCLLILTQAVILPVFSKPLLYYSVLFLDIPLVIIITKGIKAKEAGEIKSISEMLKGLMLSGILSMIFITL
jgi:4-hydroxybenzoate polyprenyltransferase